MPLIQSLGIGSGIDVQSLVDQLVSAERAPEENRLNRQQQEYQTRLSALGQVKSSLESFRSTVESLTDISAFRQTSASSSNAEAVGVAAESGANTGTYDIGVTELARAQGLASGGFAKTTTAVGTGTLTFRFGEVTTDGTGAVTGFTENAGRGAVDVAIPAEANSLADVRDAVNDADMGVRANIVNDGTSERLVFTSEKTGSANGFVVQVSDDDGSDTDNAGLSRLAFNTTATNIEQTRAARDATLSVDGLTVTRASNTVDDLIDGVTFTLKDTTSVPAEVSVSEDRSAARAQIEGFVESYNKLQGTLNQLTGYNPETQQAGPLNGSSLLRGLSSDLRAVMSTTLGELEGTGVRALADIGIATRRDGTLEIDDEELTDALENDFASVGALFARTGITDGAEQVTYTGATEATEGGRYAVDITALASQGAYTGSATAGFPLTIDSGNDTLQLSVDGVESGTITLAQGSYASGSTLAAELQSRINGDDALREAGVSVSVAYGGGALSLTSQSYGSGSTVEITGVDTDTAATLGLSVGAGSAGTDVQGTVGGAPAEGDGRVLTASAGPASGLALEIGGETTGSRGEVVYSNGLMGALERTIASYSGEDGIIGLTNESLNDRLERLQEQRRDLERRMEQVRQRYTEQFTAMDTLVAQMNQTSQYLSRQLATLPGASGEN